MNTNKTRIAIIGGGLAGLTAASKLSRLIDCEITIFEKGGTIGGRASTVNKDGFLLNQGAHALYNGGAAKAYLQEIGVTLPGGAPPLNGSLAYYQGKFHTLPTDLMAMAKTGLLNPLEKVEASKFLAELHHFNFDDFTRISFADWLRKRFNSASLIALFEGLNRLGSYSHAASKMSAAVALHQLLVAQQGVTYLDHGWQSIVQALRSSIKAPVNEYVRADVSRVEHTTVHGRDKVRVVTAACEHQFDYAILALAPAVVEKIAPEMLPVGLAQSLIPAKIACLDICLRKLPQPKPTFALGLDVPLYFSIHSASAKLTEDGGALIHMGMYLRPGEQGGDEQLNAMNQILNQLQPGWESELVYKRFLPNMVASFSVPTCELGAANGLSSPALNGTDLIYACGDWVGKEKHLLADASVHSATVAATMVAQHARQLVAC